MCLLCIKIKNKKIDNILKLDSKKLYKEAVEQ